MKGVNLTDAERIKSRLEKLNAGTYYIAIAVTQRGRYMEVKNKYGELEGGHE